MSGRDELISEAHSRIHGQRLGRRYSVAEVKQIVYPLTAALSEADEETEQESGRANDAVLAHMRASRLADSLQTRLDAVKAEYDHWNFTDDPEKFGEDYMAEIGRILRGETS